jgi:hypothetical protein
MSQFETFDDLQPGTLLTLCNGKLIDSDFITPSSLAGCKVEYGNGIKGTPLQVMATEEPYLVVKDLVGNCRHVIDTRLCKLMPVSRGYVDALVGRSWFSRLLGWGR